MWQRAKNTKATHEFAGLHRSGRHGGETIIGKGVFIAVLVVRVVRALSLAA